MLLAFFCNKQSKSNKEAEILQEGFSLIFCRVKLLPDSNSINTHSRWNCKGFGVSRCIEKIGAKSQNVPSSLRYIGLDIGRLLGDEHTQFPSLFQIHDHVLSCAHIFYSFIKQSFLHLLQVCPDSV